jgi:tryptophan synthase alpha chain
MKSSRFNDLPAQNALSIFYTAGYPRLHDTLPILEKLQDAGVAMVEIGFPFSDPVADGPTIQASNLRAIENGMNLSVLFEQLRDLRPSITIPVLLMGYLNPVEQFGVERFLQEAARCGVDGVILPDMPFEEYQDRYKPLFKGTDIKPVFLVTSRTDEARIKAFDAEEPAFLYVLSSDSVTGGQVAVSESRETFFKRLADMKLRSTLIVGFGVTDRASFVAVTKHTHGAIVGSAFVKALAALPALNAERSEIAKTELIENFILGLR